MKNLNNFSIEAILQRGKGTLTFETSHLSLLLATRDIASQQQKFHTDYVNIDFTSSVWNFCC